MKRLALLLWILPWLAFGQSWQRLENCRLVENASNDGDSFHVQQGGREYIFRLYYVDCPETSNRFPERVKAQADYFGISEAGALLVGKKAKEFTARELQGGFAVVTKGEDARGSSALSREYAFIQTSDGDLGQLLVKNGFARIFGEKAGGDDYRALQTLARAERSARGERRGAWGGAEIAVETGEAPPGTGEKHVTEASALPAMRDPDVIRLPDFEGRILNDVFSGNHPKTPESNRSQSVDLNSATVAELRGLPGIGPKLTKAIISKRPFSQVSDLRKVPGVGPVKYSAIQALVTVK